MGSGSSKPPPPPTVVEQPPPAGSGEGSILYPSTPKTPRLDGITRSLANECDRCTLQVLTGSSVSSVKVSREYGSVSESQCKRYADDKKRVQDKRFSLQDFLNNLKAGRYYRDLNNGFCEQVELSEDDAAKVTTVEQYNEGALRSVRIQKKSAGGFSSDTKARFTPSIPFRLQFSAGGAAPTEIVVKSMTLYHPAPLRLEGVQADAILSLNDPSFDNPAYVVLIPLVGRNVSEPSVNFLQKILSEVVSVSAPDPSTGQYIGRDIPTGANWTLNNLFSTVAGTEGALEVTNGYYEWKGMPTLERVREEKDETFSFRGSQRPTGRKVITYSWKESGTPPPRYIMLDTPVSCGPADLVILTQRMPVTPPLDAIHAVLYSDNPLQRGIVHKQGPPNAAACPTRESFTPLRGVTEETCDPWGTWARTADKTFTQQQIFTMIFNVLVGIAMAVGAFLALVAILRMYDVEYADFSKGVGKVTAVFFKNLKEKASAFKQKISGLRSFAGGPGAAFGAVKGPGGAGGLAALGNSGGPAAGLAALGNTGGPAAGLAALENASVPATPFAALEDSANAAASPADRLAAARAEQTEELNMQLPRVRKTRRANIPLDRRLVGPDSVAVPTSGKKQWNVNMDYLSGQGPNKRFTRRGGQHYTRS